MCDIRISVVNDINELMAKYSFIGRVEWNTMPIYVDDKIVSGLNDFLRDVILVNYFPKVTDNKFCHYTDFKSFQSIIETKTLYLTSLQKRFKEDEFLPFYKDHGLTGFASQEAEAKKKVSELVNNAFYISFTDESATAAEESYMWKHFGGMRGIKLELDIRNCNVEFRKVYYPEKNAGNDIGFLTDLLELGKKIQKLFHISGLAKIGFFYLPSKLRNEKEYRMLVKRDYAEYLNLKTFDYAGTERIALPIQQYSTVAEIRLTRVVAQQEEDLSQVQDILRQQGSAFSAVEVVWVNQVARTL